MSDGSAQPARARMMPNDTWKLQWDRVQRSFQKLQLNYHSTPEYDDVVHHFFQDAWHLKDWLKNDPGLRNKIGRIEESIKEYFHLSVAADIANATKHFVSTRRRTGATMDEREIRMLLGTETSISLLYIGVDDEFRLKSDITPDDRGRVEARQLAAKAMEEWTRFLGILKLI